MVGAGLALGGIEAVATRRMCFRSSDEAYETYAGTPALIVGMMALLVGTAVIATAYLLADGQWHATVNYLTGIGRGVWEWLEPRAFDAFVGKLPKKLEWPI